VERILAAADIGSNTAHLLVARTDGSSISEIDNENEWIGLGEIVAKRKAIPISVQEALGQTLIRYRAAAKSLGAEGIYLFATEAMRSAENHDEVARRLKKMLGLKVEAIDSTREAELSLRGLELDINPRTIDVLFEVGGGSAQIGQLFGGSLRQSESLPLGTGTVIAKNRVRHPCPEHITEDVRRYISSSLTNASFRPTGKGAAASGGVARGLWRALHKDGDPTLMPEELEYLIWATQRLSVETIVQRFDVKPKRAATLMIGAIVYLELIKWSGVSHLIVSKYGIREGALLEMSDGRIEACPP
jgi:exopolyphosphatase/guanosine-5'-triphosphate,3'-diphosphate pyrophosphatase